MNTYTLFWLDGTREVIQGETISIALCVAGYSNGAMRALDFYAEGENTSYIWSDRNNQWEYSIQKE